jgi:hypothetical protein
MIRKARDYLLKHRTGDVVLLAVITLAATSKWLNLDIPKGHDAVGDMLLAQAASHTFSLPNLLTGWSSDWSLGYPLFYVSPPLVSCLIWVLSYLFGWILGTKLLYLSFFVLSGVFAYFYVYSLTKNRCASFAAGLAYVFLPYHVLEVAFEGHHGALGLPYMLTPLILLCLERLIHKPGPRYALINGALLALLTLTYPQVLPFLVGPFLALYVILRIWWQRQRGVKYVRSAALASTAAFCLPLLLTAFWWLPLLSDIRYFAATSFPMQEARDYSATFLQAITLRPSFCCAPSSAYGASGSIILEMLRMFPFVLVVFGIILNRRNKYVWFFSVSILIGVLLAMGPDSPVKLFTLAYRYVPFFSGLRTPWRFLLFTSLAYAVLIGFCVKAVSEWLGRIHPRRLGRPGVPAILLVLTSLILLGNTWQETRTAFDTFTLTNDQRNAFAWLKAQDSGDYRIADPPFDPYVYNADAGYTIRPSYWTYLHGKENVFGSTRAVKYAMTALESLNTDLERGPFNMSQWLSIFNVKYVLLDKTNPLSSNVILDSNFERVWPSETLDIYENYAMKPRIFSFFNTNERAIDLHDGDTINLSCAEGTQEAVLSLSDEYHLSDETSVKSSYHLATAGAYLCLEVNVEGMSFSQNDAVHLAFYSQYNLPDMHLTLSLLESAGSRYDVVLDAVDGIKAGWNEVNFPVSLLVLRDSPDQNSRLDLDQINRLRIGVAREDGSNQAREFPLYFDELSVVTQEIDTSVEYTKIRPGKYKVHVNLDSPSYLVLSESYHPNWVARVDGEAIQSQMMYECLNSFYLQPGEYDLTVEFTTSPLRTAGNVITGTSIAILCIIGVFLLIRSRRDKRAARNNPHNAEAPPEPQT